MSSFLLVSAKADNTRIISLEEFQNELLEMISESKQYETVVESKNQSNVSVCTNRLIVKTESNSVLPSNYGAVSVIEGFNNWHIFQYESYNVAQQALDYFLTLDNVVYAEFDEIIEWEEEDIDEDTSNSLDSEWGKKCVKSDKLLIALEESDISLNETVVAVIDSGVDANHELFSVGNRLLDGNRPKDNIPSDYHGTHVAGIIVNNSPSNVKIKSYNYNYYKDHSNEINTSEGTKLTLATEIESSIGDMVDIINISLESWWIILRLLYSDTYNAIKESIEKAIDNNITVVVASGNKISDTALIYPANDNNVITVAAVDEYKHPYLKSNYGSCVDIAAPGVKIESSIPTGSNDGLLYEKRSGTSMATPFVSAAAAIIKSIYPNSTPEQIKDRLKNTAYKPTDWISSYGKGIVDFRAMLADKTTSPPTITIGSNSATIIAEPDSTIYYTTNGTDPTVESTVYTGAISTANIKEIKAIAVKSSLLPSETAVHTLKWKIDVDVTVNKTAKIDFPEGMSPLYIENRNPEIAVLSTDGTVEGVEIGDAVCVAYFVNNHSAVYHIHVDYNWFVRLIRKLFAWLFWIIDLFK